jgi:hypothetical protein
LPTEYRSRMVYWSLETVDGVNGRRVERWTVNRCDIVAAGWSHAVPIVLVLYAIKVLTEYRVRN